MLDSPTSENIDDFRQRYRGTFGFLKRKDNTDLLVFIKETDRSRVTFITSTGSEFYANLNKDVIFEFLPIIRGWHQTRLGPRYFLRVAERQYHRGISRGNTSVYNLTFATERFTSEPVQFDALEDVFVHKLQSPSYTNFREGVVQSFIPNKYFLMTDTSLYMYDRKIGTVENRCKLVLSDNTFTQEVGDAIRRSNLPLEVIVNE